MFNVLEGGVLEPIKWGKEEFLPDNSIILLDEYSPAIWLWHGDKQGIVARRIAMRQADSLKGHGYVIEKTIVGRDIKKIYEIDKRKAGRDPETDSLNEEFQKILNRKYEKLDDYIVVFQLSESETKIVRPVVKLSHKDKSVQLYKKELKSEIEQKIELKSELKPSVKTKQKEKIRIPQTTKKPALKPTKTLKLPEFAFESYVEETISSAVEISKEKKLLSSQEKVESTIIDNLLDRIENIENKLDLLIKHFEKFKKISKSE